MLLDRLMAMGWGGGGARIKDTMCVTFYSLNYRQIPNSIIIQSIDHNGGIPGFSSLVTFLPSDGLGIVVLINADEKSDDTVKVTNRVIDTVLGLGDKHHASRERYNFLIYSKVLIVTINLAQGRRVFTHLNLETIPPSRTIWQSMPVPTIILDTAASHSAMFLTRSIPLIAIKLLLILPLLIPRSHC